MRAVEKSIAFIESHLQTEFSLDDVAAAAGVTRFYLARAFVACTGMTTLGYARMRRLSEAAIALRRGAPDILAVALDAGYESHEAFTRACRNQFGLTPTENRASGDLRPLRLVEALDMTAFSPGAIAKPRIVSCDRTRFCGLAGRFTAGSAPGIADLWRRLGEQFGDVLANSGDVAYGVCLDWEAEKESFAYLCAVEVAASDRVPAGLEAIELPARRHAVFRHAGNVADIRRSLIAVFDHWLPASGRAIAATATYFSRFDAAFDPRTGDGGFDIFVPLQDRDFVLERATDRAETEPGDAEPWRR